MHATTLVDRRMAALFTRENESTWSLIEGIVTNESADIVREFYDTMLEEPQAARFLHRELIQDKLLHSVEGWIRRVFRAPQTSGTKSFIEFHKNIGKVHARIRVPMYLVLYAGQVIRHLLSERASRQIPNEYQAQRATRLIADMVDFAVIIINNAYLSDSLRNEREAQSLRDSIIGRDIAIECERARASLFDWNRQLLTHFYEGRQDETKAPPSLLESDVGLWITHKAELLITESTILESLRASAREIETELKGFHAIAPDGSTSVENQSFASLQEKTNSLEALLNTLSERSLLSDAARDPLTRVYNRRYLPTVLQRETFLSDTHGLPFGIAIVDVDHFKHFNDRWGHDAGDQVLRKIARILLSSVRTSDFVFRYGGEEFLIVLGSLDSHHAEASADRLRKAVESTTFQLAKDQELKLTVSVGLAFYDGHPDYDRLISRGDAALYAAKNSGRNRCAVDLGKGPVTCRENPFDAIPRAK